MSRKKTDETTEQIVNFNDAEVVSEDILGNPVVNETQQMKRPKIYDPEWPSWVMSQFEEDELEDGLPKVHGLDRLVRKLIGPIIKSKTYVKQAPTVDNEQRATAEHELVIINKYNKDENELDYVIEVMEAADAYRGNIKGLEYARFPTAMASTRARVRALRNALSLDVVASEEISDQPLEEAGLEGKITEGQITKIDIKCEQLDIDVVKLIGMNKSGYKTIEEFTYQGGKNIFQLLNNYQQDVKPIPDEIKGYSKGWRK